jgi:sugar/nucleoside kinase (ribokinase family)
MHGRWKHMDKQELHTLDFLAIGDIVNDDFIDLQDARIEKDEKTGGEMLAMRFGDKIPYKERELIYAVGNSPNAACSATRLGLRAGIMTHVGDDELGGNTIKALEERNINTDWVISEEGSETNYHFVLRYKADRTILIKHTSFKYNLAEQIKDKPVPKWIYFSSVAENSLPYHHEIAEWVKRENIKMAFQPGTFQISLGYEKLKDIYEVSEIFFCNVEEARRILEPVHLGKNILEATIKELLQMMRDLGPKIVCITDGPSGAYAYDGNETWYMPPYPDPAPPVDRTGAGDSFSSTFTSAIILGKDIGEAIQWGPINSMSVVQYVGAQAGLLSREKLIEYLNKAPEDYKAQKLEL